LSLFRVEVVLITGQWRGYYCNNFWFTGLFFNNCYKLRLGFHKKGIYQRVRGAFDKFQDCYELLWGCTAAIFLPWSHLCCHAV